MDKFEEEPQAKQPDLESLIEQAKYFMQNLPFQDQSSPSAATGSANLQNQLVSPNSIQHTEATFMVFADTIIPSTLGALDLQLDKFIVWTLDHYVSINGEWGVKTMPLSSQTASMLDMAASHLFASGDLKGTLNFSANPNGGLFAALTPHDRLETIKLLENLQVNLEGLPKPFQNNGGLVRNVVTSLHVMVLFGYYSEWFSFGSTRLAFPEDQLIERHPFIWDSLDYPGPSFGYRAFRGFLIDKYAEKGN